MQKKFYFLSPVEVVKVTTSNIQEVAAWCGGQVASTESRRVSGRMDQYVWVPTPKGTKISWAFPGMFVTKRLIRTVNDELRITYAVFRRDYFDKNYFDSPTDAVNMTWGSGKAEGKAVVGKGTKKSMDQMQTVRNNLEVAKEFVEAEVFKSIGRPEEKVTEMKRRVEEDLDGEPETVHPQEDNFLMGTPPVLTDSIKAMDELLEAVAPEIPKGFKRS